MTTESTTGDNFVSAQLKAARAQKHIEDLHAAIERFIDQQQSCVHHEYDETSGKHRYFLGADLAQPLEVMLIFDDALACMRAALDHVVHELWVINGGTGEPPRNLTFPLAENEEIYKTSARNRIKTLPEYAIATIDAMKPYGGYYETLWSLHTLNNTAKHRIVSAGFAKPAVIDVSDSINKLMPEGVNVRASLRPRVDSDYPIKGDLLHEFTAPADAAREIRFVFSVVINDPSLLKTRPVIEVAQKILISVNWVIRRMARSLSEQTSQQRSRSTRK